MQQQQDQITMWNPSMKMSDIEYARMYLINPDDFGDKLALTPFTAFKSGGVYMKITGLRLSTLLKPSPLPPLNNNDNNEEKKFKKTSKRNVCFQTMESAKLSVFLSQKLPNMPPCIRKILADLESTQGNPRGGMYRKRFILNCYICNVLTCTKCDSRCLLEALTQFYNGEPKCVAELMHLMVKSQNAYKPPNCHKMKTVDKLCPNPFTCKGANPICNF